MNRDCYVIGKMDAIFIARQLLEVVNVLNEINYPYYNFHCGNLLITEESIEVIDMEFALAGQSTFNRHSLIRSKVQVQPIFLNSYQLTMFRALPKCVYSALLIVFMRC